MSLATLGPGPVLADGGRRRPGNRGVDDRALEGGSAVPGRQFRLGIGHVQPGGHDDEQEHREREAEYRRAEGPCPTGGVSKHTVHSGSLLPLRLTALKERRTAARTAGPSRPDSSRWWRRRSATPGTAGPGRSQCTWGAARRMIGPG